MAGRYFDEWQVGDRVAHALTRTVTETDNLLITTLTHNPQPLHLDYEAAAKTEFRKPLVNSCFTFSLLVGISVHDTTLGTLVANLGFDKVQSSQRRYSPATRCAAKANASTLRESKSRPNAGIVTWAHRAFNQRDELVCECTRTALHPEEARMMQPRSWLFVPGGQREEDRQGARQRGRRDHLRPRGQRRARA